MSCPDNSTANVRRNIILNKYPETVEYFVQQPDLPVWTRPYLQIDPRQVRLLNPPMKTIDKVVTPERTMRFSYGCDNCIRNDKVIFSP